MLRLIHIVPFEHIDSMILRYLQKELAGIFDAEIIFERRLPIPQFSLNQYRNQYRTKTFLDALQKVRERGKIVGICSVDIYAKNYDFIFGLADPTSQVAIVSIERLKPSYYGVTQDDSVFLPRVLKETTHELGHLYGLEHCHRTECVMHCSIALIDTDIKSARFCGECQRELSIAIETTDKQEKRLTTEYTEFTE